MPERSRVVKQADATTPKADVGPTTHPGVILVVVAESDEDNEEEDPMVSTPVHPFLTRHGLTEVHQEALIDSGCTHCLMRRAVANHLGLRLVKMKKPIAFE